MSKFNGYLFLSDIRGRSICQDQCAKESEQGDSGLHWKAPLDLITLRSPQIYIGRKWLWNSHFTECLCSTLFIAQWPGLRSHLLIPMVSVVNWMLINIEFTSKDWSASFGFSAVLTWKGGSHLNPGPVYRFSCTIYSNPVKSNQRGVCCNRCDHWSHASCCNISCEDYDRLSSDNQPWFFHSCASSHFLSFRLQALASAVSLPAQTPRPLPPFMTPQFPLTPQPTSSPCQWPPILLTKTLTSSLPSLYIFLAPAIKAY